MVETDRLDLRLPHQSHSHFTSIQQITYVRVYSMYVEYVCVVYTADEGGVPGRVNVSVVTNNSAVVHWNTVVCLVSYIHGTL